jgi:hypothetical protein
MEPPTVKKQLVLEQVKEKFLFKLKLKNLF